MASEKVVDVTITVTCMEKDLNFVRRLLAEWYEGCDVPLVQRTTGGLKNGTPKRMEPWMKAAFGLE